MHSWPLFACFVNIQVHELPDIKALKWSVAALDTFIDCNEMNNYIDKWQHYFDQYWLLFLLNQDSYSTELILFSEQFIHWNH